NPNSSGQQTSATPAKYLQDVVGRGLTIGRYENKGAQPSADILSKLADALDVTTDYLMSGSQDEMAEGISDKELMTQFKRIAKLPKEKKAIVKELLDAFLLKNDLREKLAQ